MITTGPTWQIIQFTQIIMRILDSSKSINLANVPDGFADNPYPWYQQILSESPVVAQTDGSYLVAPHRLLTEIYRDTVLFSSDKQAVFKPRFGNSPLYDHHTTSLVFNDAPLHTRVRRIMAGAMTPSAIAHIEQGLSTLVDDLLDDLANNKKDGAVDLIEHFASQIPINIIGNLLDIPMQERSPLRDWSLSILGALEPTLTPQQEKKGNRAVSEFLAYLAELVKKREKKPGNPDTDVLTRLMFSNKGSLSNAELLHNCIFILNAGHETTTNLIGNAIGSLHENPQSKHELIHNPDIIHTAIDEFLRFESPNQIGNRLTTKDTQIAGQHIKANTNIHLLIGAANRDPAEFNNPNQLLLSRTPNRHLAFAGGPHACIGLNLARLEGRVAIGKFVQRFPGFDITDAERSPRLRFRGYNKLLASL